MDCDKGGREVKLGLTLLEKADRPRYQNSFGWQNNGKGDVNNQFLPATTLKELMQRLREVLEGGAEIK